MTDRNGPIDEGAGNPGEPGKAGVRDAGLETQAGPVRRELLIGCAALVIAVGCLVAARGITAAVRTEGISPSAWPTAVALGMIALASTLMVRTLLAARRTAPPTAGTAPGAANSAPTADDLPERASPGGRTRVAAALAAFVAYGVVWQWIDFRVCTVGLIAALAWIGGGRGWRSLLAFPIGLTAALWALFGVALEVPL